MDETTAASSKKQQHQAEEEALAEEEAASDDIQADHEGGEIQASAYYSDHDLREMFSRENTSRRRQAGHTLRKYLTDKQDKQILGSFVKIRDEYAVTNNNDVVIVWAQQLLEQGKGDDLDPYLVELAESLEIPKRATPWDDEKGR